MSIDKHFYFLYHQRAIIFDVLILGIAKNGLNPCYILKGYYIFILYNKALKAYFLL